MRAIAPCLVAAAAVALVGCGGEKSSKGLAAAKQANAAAAKPVQSILPRANLARVPGASSFLASGGRKALAGIPPNSCQGQWTAPSPLVFIQEGYRYWITLYLKQDGQKVWGYAGYKIGSKETWGRVSGGITGNRLFIRVYWSTSGSASIGVYMGEIGSWAWIFQGRTYDQNATPAIVKEFNSSQATPFFCAPVRGLAEVVRRAVPEEQYQAEFERFTKAGYRPVWVDGFRAEGKGWFNVIFRPDDGTPWIARHNLTGDQYQAEFNAATNAGYRLVHVESYPSATGIRYAAIFVKAAGPAWLTYHGRPEGQHQALFNQRTAEGWVPVIISVTPSFGQRWYTALYEKKEVGSFWAQQVLDPGQYQTEIDRQIAAGRKLVYLNAYTDGGVRFTAIWHSNAPPMNARHGLMSPDFQAVLDAQRAQGLFTRALTGYEDGTKVYYASFWTR